MITKEKLESMLHPELGPISRQAFNASYGYRFHKFKDYALKLKPGDDDFVEFNRIFNDIQTQGKTLNDKEAKRLAVIEFFETKRNAEYEKLYQAAYNNLDAETGQSNLELIKKLATRCAPNDPPYAIFIFKYLCLLVNKGMTLEIIDPDSTAMRDKRAQLQARLAQEPNNSDLIKELKNCSLMQVKFSHLGEEHVFSVPDDPAADPNDSELFKYLAGLSKKTDEQHLAAFKKTLDLRSISTKVNFPKEMIGPASSLSAEILNEAYKLALAFCKNNQAALMKLNIGESLVISGMSEGRGLTIVRDYDGSFMLVLEPGDVRYDGSKRQITWDGGRSNICTPTYRIDGTEIEMVACRTMDISTPEAKAKFAREKELIRLLQYASGTLTEYIGPSTAGSRKIFSPYVLDSLQQMLGQPVPGLDQTLYTLIPSLPPVAAYNLEITSRLIAAMSNVHTAGVEHLDFKPEHALISRDAEGKLSVYIIDFDRSREMGSDKTLEDIEGTPTYYSPEMLRVILAGKTKAEAIAALKTAAASTGQAEHADYTLNSYAWHLLTKDMKDDDKFKPLSEDEQLLTGKNDLFSLGITVFQILTGKVLTGTQADLEFWRELDDLVKKSPLFKKMLAADPADRTTAANIAEELATLLANKQLAESTTPSAVASSSSPSTTAADRQDSIDGVNTIFTKLQQHSSTNYAYRESFTDFLEDVIKKKDILQDLAVVTNKSCKRDILNKMFDKYSADPISPAPSTEAEWLDQATQKFVNLMMQYVILEQIADSTLSRNASSNSSQVDLPREASSGSSIGALSPRIPRSGSGFFPSPHSPKPKKPPKPQEQLKEKETEITALVSAMNEAAGDKFTHKFAKPGTAPRPAIDTATRLHLT